MPPAPISHARRAMSVAAPLALFALTVDTAGRGLDTQAQSTWLIISCTYVAGPVLVLACLCVTGRRALARVDVATLATAVVLGLASFRGAGSRPPSANQSDESLLDRFAARALIRGHNPYLERFQQVASDGHGTPLFSGHSVDRFAYPPLPIELTWLLHHIDAHITSPAVLNVLVMVVLGCVVFFTVPDGWRPLVVVVLLGLAPERSAVVGSSGVVVAAALLCGALFRWTGTGRDGRLGPTGLLQGLLVGLACACYQLSWVLTVFLVVGIFELRRGEIGWVRALAVIVRYVLVAGIAFVLVNLPFLVDNASAWGSALLSVFTQKAIVFGQGWALALVLAHGGSGGIALMTLATAVLVVVFVVLFVWGFERLAPALPILATLCFALSTRTSGFYVSGFWPVWVVGAATIDRELVSRVAPSRLLGSGVLRDRRVQVGAAVALLLVPLGIFLAGVAMPSPLVARIAGVQVTAAGRIVAIRLTVRNTSDHPVDASYYVDPRYALTDLWPVTGGRNRLGPGTRQTVELAPEQGHATPVASGLWVVATLPDPEAMTATPLVVGRRNVEVTGRAPQDARGRQVAGCWAAVLDGGGQQCTGGFATFGVADQPDSLGK